jgi:hypothetical protein
MIEEASASFRLGEIPLRQSTQATKQTLLDMTCLSGELFFVGAVIFFLLAWQAHNRQYRFVSPSAQPLRLFLFVTNDSVAKNASCPIKSKAQRRTRKYRGAN